MGDAIDVKLYPKILEKSLAALGLPINYSLLGDGLFGQAYLSGDKVYKITTDRSEAVESSKLVGKTNSHIANVYSVKKINTALTNQNLYLIVLEHLNTKRSNIFKEIEDEITRLFHDAFNMHYLDVLYYYRFEPLRYESEYKDEVNSLLEAHQREKFYYNSLLKIVDELKANGIESLDIQYHNLGLKSNGNLAFFDLGFGDERETNFDQLNLSERVKTYMKNSSSVDVKKNCQLAGKGNTSDACNQGDIRNLNIKPLNEIMEIVDEDAKDIHNTLATNNLTITDFAEIIAKKAGFNDLNYLGSGTMGFAYDIGDGKVMKVTSDKSEANEAYKLIGKQNKHIGNFYNVYTFDEPYNNIFVIIREKLEVRPNNARKYIDAFDNFLDNEINTNNGDLTIFGLERVIDQHDQEKFDKLNKTMANYDRNQNRMIFMFYDLVVELFNNNIRSADFIPYNFGFRNDGTLAYYDIGYSKGGTDAQIPKFDINENTGGFDLKTFDSLKSFAARKKYADQILQKIGTGSSRIVYQLPDGNVLKLASNKKGIDQNSNECGLGQDNFFGEILARVFDCDQNDLWIVSEKANRINERRFEEILGFKFKDMAILLQNLKSRNSGGRDIYHIDQEIVDKLYEEPFVSMITQLMESYNLMAGDLAKINSYGEVIRDGSPDVVLIDYGLNTDTWDTHYEKRRKNRYLWEDYFGMNEENIVDINDLPFKDDVIKAGGKLYSVGGAVRDKLLGKESKDLDILITGIPLDQLETILAKYGRVDNVGKSFGIIKFNTPQTGEIDIAIPRTERKNDQGGYQGFDVTSDHTLPIEKDLERRDFTINAIAKDNYGFMIDPYCGVDDINNKCIRMVNPQAFSDDPLRMLRAVQFASRFNFNIEPETMKSIQLNAQKIKEISPERILIEFDKIVNKGNPLVGAKLLRQTNLYPYIFGSNRGINLSGFDKVKTMGEFIYMLLKDTNPSPSEFYKKNLKGDLDTYNEIRALEIGGEIRQDELGNPYKRIFDMYKIYPNIINTELFGGNIKRLASDMKSNNIPFSLKEVPVNGNDLMELGYKGKEIGDTFVNILNKIYRKELRNDRESILNYLKSLK